MEDNEMLKALNEEWQKKLDELEKKHKEELEKVRKEESDKAVSQLRAIISGRSESKEETKGQDEDKDPYEVALEETRANFGLKNKNKGEN